MDRGEVHFIELLLPDWSTGGAELVPRQKLVVALRGGPSVAGESYVPVVLASSDNRTMNEPLQPYEVSVDTSHGFHHDTLLDCRWVFSLAQSRFSPTTFRFSLPDVVMNEVSVALVVGLQI